MPKFSPFAAFRQAAYDEPIPDPSMFGMRSFLVSELAPKLTLRLTTPMKMILRRRQIVV